MAIVQDLLAWIRSLLGGDKTISLIEKHLGALEDRRRGYEDRRKEMEGDLTEKEAIKEGLLASIAALVGEGKGDNAEATRLGHDCDTLEEVLSDLQARVGNRRSLETLLRRVISAGEEMRDFLPQQPDLAPELESNLAQLVQQAQAENAEALGRLLAFLEEKVQLLGDTGVGDRSAQKSKAPNSLQRAQEREEERNRLELDDADSGLDLDSEEPDEKPRLDISENA